jgi:hypothetical protein
MIVGNATANANIQAFIQIEKRLPTSPMLKIVITKDMMQDISKDIKKEKTYR